MLPIISTVLLLLAFVAFLLGALGVPPGRVNYIALGLALAALAFLLKG